MALSVSEAAERSAKFSHENHNIQRKLHIAESELVSAKAENKRCKEENASLREKMKGYNSGKIGADKKVAEVSAHNSRLEVSCKGARDSN